MLDDIIRHSVSWMFPGYEILDTFSIKLTRDAELYIDDEFSGDLVQKIRDSLNKRHVGPTSRFVFDREMPAEMFQFLSQVFDLEKYDTLREGRYHNNFDFFRFPDFGLTQLKNQPLPTSRRACSRGASSSNNQWASPSALSQVIWRLASCRVAVMARSIILA